MALRQRHSPQSSYAGRPTINSWVCPGGISVQHTILLALVALVVLTHLGWFELFIRREMQVPQAPHTIRRLTAETPFVFLHIPKTAGTTITEFMKLSFRRNCTEVRFDDKWNVDLSLSEGVRFTSAISKYNDNGIVDLKEATARVMMWHNMPCFFTHTLAGPDFDGRTALLHAVIDHGARFRYVMGHFPHGYCAFAEKGCVYVTVLREPMGRMFSHYEYLRRMHPQYIQDICHGKCNEFEAFVQMLWDGKLDSMCLDNMQTRMLAGDGFWATLSGSRTCANSLHSCDIAETDAITATTLVKAKHNIKTRYAVVGVMDHLPLFKRAMEEVFDMESTGPSWAMTDFKNNNDKKAVFDPKKLSKKTQKQLHDIQKYDIDLYDFVLKLVIKQYAELKAMPKRTREVKKAIVRDEIDDKVIAAVAKAAADKVAKAMPPASAAPVEVVVVASPPAAVIVAEQSSALPSGEDPVEEKVVDRRRRRTGESAGGGDDDASYEEIRPLRKRHRKHRHAVKKPETEYLSQEEELQK